jgi:hypothetical protein
LSVNPERFRSLAFDIKDFLISCLWRLLREYGMIMFITFCELSIGLWALQVPGFWKVAAVTAVLDILRSSARALYCCRGAFTTCSAASFGWASVC